MDLAQAPPAIDAITWVARIALRASDDSGWASVEIGTGPVGHLAHRTIFVGISLIQRLITGKQRLTLRTEDRVGWVVSATR